MKHLSFKIIILCLIAPPVLYIFIMQQVEHYLVGKYKKEIEEIYIGDTRQLFDGSKTLKNVLNQNINAYLSRDFFIVSGVKVSVTVVNRQGMILYPDTFNENSSAVPTENPIEIAAENYSILNAGLNLKIGTSLDHNTLPANILLIVLVFFIKADRLQPAAVLNKTKRIILRHCG